MEKRCNICGRKLKTSTSRLRNIGPTCEKKHIEELNKGQVKIEELETTDTVHTHTHTRNKL